MTKIEKMSRENGKCIYEGETYILTQQAYAENGKNGGVIYKAHAIKENEKPDATGYVDAYLITWALTEYAEAHMDEIEDESECCDWENPIDCKRADWYKLED